MDKQVNGTNKYGRREERRASLIDSTINLASLVAAARHRRVRRGLLVQQPPPQLLDGHAPPRRHRRRLLEGTHAAPHRLGLRTQATAADGLDRAARGLAGADDVAVVREGDEEGADRLLLLVVVARGTHGPHGTSGKDACRSRPRCCSRRMEGEASSTGVQYHLEALNADRNADFYSYSASARVARPWQRHDDPRRSLCSRDRAASHSAESCKATDGPRRVTTAIRKPWASRAAWGAFATWNGA